MSDRFKFRCWDKESSEYIQWGWNPDYGLELDFTTGKLMWQSVPDGEDEYPKELNTKQLVVEQCTGLKDKNGNLIYENDIIIAPNNSHKLIVIRMKNGVYGCKEYRFNGVWEMNLYDLIKHYGVEIIGNIHNQGAENAE